MEPWIVLCIILSVLSVLLVLFFVRSGYERRHPMIRSYTVESEKIPADFSGFRVAYLSDQHGESPGKAGERAEKLIEECRADLVLIGGDMMTVHRNEPYNPEPFSRLLRAIPSGTPVYFADGNHETRMAEKTDIYPGWAEHFDGLLRDRCVIRLKNERITLHRGESRIYLSASDLPKASYVQKFRKAALPADYFRETLGEKPEGFELMLVHSPQYIKEACDYGADLVFSGHFHGGTIRLFGIGLMTPQFQLFNRWCHGLYSFNGHTGIVGSGLGTHSINIRFCNRPEIVLVTLKKPSQEQEK